MGETPFSLAFGTEAVVPAEVFVPSLRTNFAASIDQNSTNLRLSLDLTEEKRQQAQIRIATYQQRVKASFNKRVKPRDFQVGDFVVRQVTQSTKQRNAGKLAPKWEGPYKVIAREARAHTPCKIKKAKFFRSSGTRSICEDITCNQIMLKFKFK